MSGQTSCGAEVHGEYLPWGYSDKGILPLLLPVVCMGVYVAHLTLLLKDRHGRGSALSRLGAELELRRSGSSLGPSQ